MSLIQRFHATETAHRLFELGAERGVPIWDVVRYHVYLRYLYPEAERRLLDERRPHPWRDYLRLAALLPQSLARLFRRRGRSLVITCSRYRDAEGRYFDKAASTVIEALGPEALVLEPVLGKPLRYPHVYDLVCVFRRFHRGEDLPDAWYETIARALREGLGSCPITKADLTAIYRTYQSDVVYYRWLLRLTGARRVFVAEGNPKAIIMAARSQKAPIILIQHGAIEFDSIEYSYPAEITPASKVLFADQVLTLGDYWCRGINVPAPQVVSVGNDLFSSRQDRIEDDGSILIISTIIHGGEMSKLAQEISCRFPDKKIIYKLHPNEFHRLREYVSGFSDRKNIKIITDSPDVSILVSRAHLVIVIASAVFYEAIDQRKKVAVYRRLNFISPPKVLDLPNVYHIDSVADVGAILKVSTADSAARFYKSTDWQLLNQVLRQSAMRNDRV